MQAWTPPCRAAPQEASAFTGRSQRAGNDFVMPQHSQPRACL